MFPDVRIISLSHLSDMHLLPDDIFSNLPLLRKLQIRDSRIDGSLTLRLTSSERFMSLSITHCDLRQPPKILLSPKSTPSIRLNNNKITEVQSGAFCRLRCLLLDLSHNQLSSVAKGVFEQSSIATLRLAHNPELTVMDDRTFAGVTTLLKLDVSRTSLVRLPTVGLETLKTLQLKETWSLSRLPSLDHYPALTRAHLTYTYHCCIFSRQLSDMKDQNCEDSSRKQKRSAKGHWGALSALPVRVHPAVTEQSPAQRHLVNWLAKPVNNPGRLINQTAYSLCNERMNKRRVRCWPKATALSPCEDVMGWWSLRVLVWLVALLALTGNVLVLVLLLVFRHRRMRVHYMLVANLAVADLFIGLYLLLLAVQDARSLGEYYNHAVDWQHGLGCKLAGFLLVFGTQLTITTMFLISFEIWYNTKYIFYGERLSLSVASCLMGAAWLLSTVMAVLPLVGVSSYQDTAICLPLHKHNISDTVYLVTSLSFALIAFFGISNNYVRIFSHLNGPIGSARSEDIAVAKKMFLLIVTDFLCWAPTFIFGGTALAGMPLIDISTTKVFLVIFFPINCCANPFLYVFFTKVMRDDVRKLIKAMRRKQMNKAHNNTTKTNCNFQEFYATRDKNEHKTALLGHTNANDPAKRRKSVEPKHNEPVCVNNTMARHKASLQDDCFAPPTIWIRPEASSRTEEDPRRPSGDSGYDSSIIHRESNKATDVVVH